MTTLKSPAQLTAEAQAVAMGVNLANKADRMGNQPWGRNQVHTMYRKNAPLKWLALDAYNNQLMSLNGEYRIAQGTQPTPKSD